MKLQREYIIVKFTVPGKGINIMVHQDLRTFTITAKIEKDGRRLHAESYDYKVKRLINTTQAGQIAEVTYKTYLKKL